MYCPKVLGGKRPFLYKYMIQSLKMTLLLHFSVGVELYTTTRIQYYTSPMAHVIIWLPWCLLHTFAKCASFCQQ